MTDSPDAPPKAPLEPPLKVRDSGSPPPRWLLKLVTRTHVFLNRASGGRLLNKLAGNDVCFVTMTGAKSGRSITVPLMYVPYIGSARDGGIGSARDSGIGSVRDGGSEPDGVLLVGSQGGAPRDPVWVRNLVAHPEIRVRHRGRSLELRARMASPEEKPSLWPVCDAHYAPYAQYRQRTSRDIPIFVCEPRGATAG